PTLLPGSKGELRVTYWTWARLPYRCGHPTPVWGRWDWRWGWWPELRRWMSTASVNCKMKSARPVSKNGIIGTVVAGAGRRRPCVALHGRSWSRLGRRLRRCSLFIDGKAQLGGDHHLVGKQLSQQLFQGGGTYRLG